jgi:transposase
MTRVELFESIRRDHRLEGLSIRALASKYKVHRRLVRQALASAVPPPRKEPVRASPVTGQYQATIREWLVADQEVHKKQRHTAHRVWTRLVAEHGADVGESTVREVVRAVAAEIAAPPEAMVPQLHLPGAEGEVDFGDIYVVIAGQTVKLAMFSLRLSASAKACHKAFATQAQEAFLAGHEDAFTRMGGVPGRIRYDNLKPAVARVLLGRDRVESQRFVMFRSHFGFDSFYCRPGIEGSHEKGGVEGDIGWFRRNHLVPVPKLASLAELNEMIAACDDADLARVVEGKRATIGEDFVAEQESLSPLPAGHFEVGVPLKPKVDAKSRVSVRQCRYSVPVRFIGRRVDVVLRADEVVISSAGRVLARHDRLVHRLDESLQLDHYLEVLLKKPGALTSSAPLAQARCSGAFSATHDAYWQQARRQLGDRDGTRALVGALLLHRNLKADAVVAGMASALRLCTVSPEVVAVEARRHAGQHLAPVIALGDLARFARPEPDLARYDGLLTNDGGWR